MLKTLVLGFLAGLMISIGGSVYLSCSVNYVGALLFSVALYVICLFGFALYTGKIGFVVVDHSRSNIISILLSLVGNFIGCVAFGLLINIAIPKIAQSSQIICDLKLNQNILSALIRAFFCGVLMYIAVWVYREKKSVLGIFICIPVFILSGFEHSIADMFYFAVAGIFSLRALLYLLLIVLGNALGGVFIPLMLKLADVKCKKANKNLVEEDNANN